MPRCYWAVLISIGVALPGVARAQDRSAALAVGGPAAAVSGTLPVDERIPIRRVRGTEARLHEILNPVESGPLVRLPRAEFEARVRSAARTAEEAKLVPRVVDVRLRAALVRGELTGTAELDIVNPATTPRFLLLDPLRVALGPATWSDGRVAVVGIAPAGNGISVLVDRSGQQTLRFEWSLAGVSELGERRFEIRVPGAPTAGLSLDLPAGLVPAASATEVLLTGPFPIRGDPPRAEWRFRFGGRSRLDFAVRQADNTARAASASLVARYQLSSGQLTGTFEYDMRPAKGSVGEWDFMVDPGLRVTDVVVNNRSGWTLDPPDSAGGPRRLRVTLNQPGAGGKVLISAVGPHPDRDRGPRAPLPTVRPEEAILDDESIEIRLAPGLRPMNWDPGDYRLTDAQILPDQTRVLSLVGSLLAPGADRINRRLPALQSAPIEAEFSTVEQIVWRFDASRAMATARVVVKLHRGLMFHFALRMPSGYSLQGARSAADEIIAYHGSVDGTARVEFARSLTGGQSADLTFEFRGPALGSGPLSLPFPDFDPLGAIERVGVIALCPGPLWRAESVPGPGTHGARWFEPGLPRVPADATAAYWYRGSGPDGIVHLLPVRGEFEADTSTHVVQVPGAAVGTTTFSIQVRSGALSELLLAEPGSTAVGRTWRVSGGGNAVAAAVALPLPGRPWLIRFARPATGRTILESRATRTDLVLPDSNFARWIIPGAPVREGKSATDRPPQPAAAEWSFSGLYLVTVVQSQSESTAIFGGTIERYGGTSLPIRLPAGADVQAAGVGNRWLGPGALASGAGSTLRLPVADSGPVRFEVHYRMQSEVRGPAGHVQSPEPALPVSGEVQRWWVFSSSVLPGWPARAWDAATAADLPRLLDDSPILRDKDILVSRSPVEEVRVGTTRAADALGAGLASAILALAWAGGRRRRAFFGVAAILAILMLATTRLVAPPWWQRVAVVPLGFGLVAAAIMVLARARSLRFAAVASLPLAALLAPISSQSWAQIPAEATVVILPPDLQGQEQVVAPRALLQQLNGSLALQGVIISSCEYALTTDESGARVTAKFVVQVLQNEAAAATLPLAEARLEKVAVNGSAAFPAAPRPGVYTVPLPGKGRHEIEAIFSVPLAGTAPEREVRFGIPECPASRLIADLPGNAQQVQIAGRVGRQETTDGPRVQLKAELGALKTVHLRWREGMGGAAQFRVREACVWDLAESGAELTACYIVRVEQGTVSSLRFDLPADLDTLSVSVRPLDMGGATALRDWTLLGSEQSGSRPLRIDLQAPTAGRLLVVLTCAPRKVLTRQPVLRFPKPILPAKSAERDAVFVLRTRGVSVEEFVRSGVIDYAPDALARDRDFNGITELRLDPNQPGRVHRLSPGGDPELRPTIRAGTEPEATQETTWHLSTRRAQANGTVRWSGKDAVVLVEFTAPGLPVREIRGEDILDWNQAGARTQVWLRKPLKEGAIDWVGTVADAPANPFEAVVPHVIGMRLVRSTVRLAPSEGFAVTAERDRGWERIAGPDPLPAWTTNSSNAPRLQIRVRPVQRTARLEDLGWLGRPRRESGVEENTPAAVHPPAVPPADIAVVIPRRPVPVWVWPVSAVAGWGVAVAVVILLYLRFPQTTGPEQTGILAGLFGMAFIGGLWPGLAIWLLLRLRQGVRSQVMNPHPAIHESVVN